VPDSKIKILTPGVLISNEKVDLDSLLRKYGLLDRELYFMVNRLVKEKGVYEILYAWKMFQKHASPNKVLVIIGRGPEKDNLKRLVAEWGLNKSVIFIDQLPNQEIRQLYHKVKCLLLGSWPTPLWQEQFGYVLAEAIMANCPVITAYSGAIPEVVEDAGLLCSPGNPVSFQEALVKLEDIQLYKQLQKNCQRVAKKFALDSFKKQLINTYQEVIAL